MERLPTLKAALQWQALVVLLPSVVRQMENACTDQEAAKAVGDAFLLAEETAGAFLDELDEPPKAPEQWARVELMGHRVLLGSISEVHQFGTTMIRIEAIDEKGELEPAQEYGGGSIYCLTRMPKEQAYEAAKPEWSVFCCKCGMHVGHFKGFGRPEPMLCEQCAPEDDLPEDVPRIRKCWRCDERIEIPKGDPRLRLPQQLVFCPQHGVDDAYPF